MSVTGIASSILSTLSRSHDQPSRFQQTRNEFQQLGQDLQAGNLTKAQTDFTTLSQDLSGTNQSNRNTTSSVSPAFSQLGQDVRSGNLQAAQQDFTTLQHDLQQNAARVGGYQHRHHPHEADRPDNSSSAQQTNSIVQAFSQLAQTLLAGNLQGAQQAFSTVQNDLQQIGGFITSGSGSVGSTAARPAAGNLNVTV